MPTWPKFIQIAADAEDVFALDSKGRVWIFVLEVQAWQRLSARHIPGFFGIKDGSGPDS